MRVRASPTSRFPSALALLLLASACSRSTIPTTLSDVAFWQLVETISEPPGTFTLSENLVSNEPDFAERVRRLRPSGGVYVGVGPEQNFSYIARLRPAMAFIVDIRAENRNLHLLYKALFEVAADRTDFVSRLFSRRCPPLAVSATADDIFDRCAQVARDSDLLATTTSLVRDRLLNTHGYRLSAADIEGMDAILKTFFHAGPEIHFWKDQKGDTLRPSYRALMTARDRTGASRSYLASEGSFRVVQDLHRKNLIVPVVGDFSGPTALRRVGDYVRQHSSRIVAFYGSNVKVYLTNQQMIAFCGNLATLPASSSAVFIQSDSIRPLTSWVAGCASR